jgi:hypothetical protein
MADDTTTYEALIVKIDARLSSILDNPRPNYTVNGVTMSMGSLIDTLSNLRADLLKRLNSIPAEAWDTMDSRVNTFGQDVASYLGEDY